ncbi:hypothetical protein H7U19_11210 [Hyunsoonleella sp. SJ7]|uniref:Pectate lyase domain-containing protein n=1 Tax=Hyunsoonleella aquatilis TaxID=2762758 RepID=A0A923KKY7_9FLAO|nr:Ig-like domain-containing protein [Hyunsoonleella aquatilis]MBC3758977.1 hypothetical protein [Hyunsoonleella aquatilis]
MKSTLPTFKPMVIFSFLIILLTSCNKEELFIPKELLQEEEEITTEEEEIGDNEFTVILNDDFYETYENTAITIDPSENDGEINSDIILSYTDPSNGILIIENESIVYTPNDGFTGEDSFIYEVCDGETGLICFEANVNIMVNVHENTGIEGEFKAFPSAYGAGAYITGGRGGRVLHITRLDDAYEPGTLRWALNQKYPRIIVFDVSGVININTQTIHLNGDDYGDVSILGQTAPRGGITITGGRIWFEYTRNLIIRYIKFRNGHTSNNGDCLTIARSTDVIVDHCSFSYSKDEALDVAGSFDPTDGNITLSNNLFGECKTAMIVGHDNVGPYGSVSVLRNATANVGWRFPKTGGALEIDIINNVHHNWKNRTIRMDDNDFTVNQINNYYQAGSETGFNALAKMWTNPNMSPRIHTSGNFVSPSIKPDGFDEDQSLGWQKFHTSTVELKPEWFSDVRLPIQGAALPILSSEEAFDDVLSSVGACHSLNSDGSVDFFRDSLDEGYVDLIRNKSNQRAMGLDAYGAMPTSIPSNIRPDDYDTDGDGMPDEWERLVFGDLTKEANGDEDGDGYSNLEEFLYQI